MRLSTFFLGISQQVETCCVLLVRLYLVVCVWCAPSAFIMIITIRCYHSPVKQLPMECKKKCLCAVCPCIEIHGYLCQQMVVVVGSNDADYHFLVELLAGSINSLVIQGEPVVFDQEMMETQGVMAANACVSVSCENGGKLCHSAVLEN